MQFTRIWAGKQVLSEVLKLLFALILLNIK